MVTPAGLKATAKQMAGKAPGPDSWTAEHFLSLPDRWWEAFSRLWQAILLGAPVPQEWRRSLVALLPKKVVATRPIGLLQIAWRIGAKAVCRQLRALVDHILCVRGGRLVSLRQMPIFASTALWAEAWRTSLSKILKDFSITCICKISCLYFASWELRLVLSTC